MSKDFLVCKQKCVQVSTVQSVIKNLAAIKGLQAFLPIGFFIRRSGQSSGADRRFCRMVQTFRLEPK